jgi:hypothetical protein
MLLGVLRSRLVPLTGVLDLLGVRTARLKRGVDDVSIFEFINQFNNFVLLAFKE